MSYFDVAGHASMVFDHTRNHQYELAIKAAVHADSVVLDLGAGLGILGFIAAKAGAKKVYLVDPSPAVLAAAEVARANGLDNVVCLQGTIEALQLPEPVDLIISVFTGNFLLGEDLLPSLFAARDKYLKPGGKLIPDSAQMWVAPVQAEDVYQSKFGCWQDNKTATSMSAHYGLDFSAAAKYVENQVYWHHFTAAPTFLAPPQVIKTLDFYGADRAECFSINRFECSRGICHGWLGWFSMSLGETELSTSPEQQPTHWSQAFLALDPVALNEGEILELALHRPERGEFSWFTSGASEQRRSSFLAVPRSVENITKADPAYLPSKTARAKFVVYVLNLFDQGLTLAEVQARARRDHSAAFSTLAELDNYFEWLVQRYG